MKHIAGYPNPKEGEYIYMPACGYDHTSALEGIYEMRLKKLT